MGRIIQFPCRDEYDEFDYEYEEYYGEENYLENEIDQDYGNSSSSVRENWFKRFIRKYLMFVLMRL